MAEQWYLSTIAIPALGTGSTKFPAKISAEQTFQCISKFVNSFPQGTSLKRITVVVFDGTADCKTVKQLTTMWTTAIRIEAQRNGSSPCTGPSPVLLATGLRSTAARP
ncbi:hypothetical protein DPMN_105704 [Dreissena polymorpha]|uniref:Uncharacterized protein n=1 Tax=Dreissena polymorpha TaxID=45954 RepID=A0A9D4K3N8_DREPO|nr:hypothetical protein DPMN_105704 [Dreissena polymorpha]